MGKTKLEETKLTNWGEIQHQADISIDEYNALRAESLNIPPHSDNFIQWELPVAQFTSARLHPKRLTRQAQDILEAVGFRMFIAGGYARYVAYPKLAPKPTDIDLFFYNSNMYYLRTDPDAPPDDLSSFKVSDRAIDLLEGIGYTITRDLPNAIEMIHSNKRYYPIQVIKPFVNQWMRTYGTIRQVLSQFDFSIAMAAIERLEHDGYWLTTGDQFHQDLKDKRLHIYHINCPVAVSLRIGKMCSKGFSIGAREVMRLFHEWDRRPKEFKDHLLSIASRDDLNNAEVWEVERLLRID